MELFKLFGSIFIDNTKADEAISKTEKKAEGLGNKLLKGVGVAAKWGAGLAAAGVTAVGGMIALAEQTAQTADYIDKLSERTGINREELQRWKYAADQSGADVGKLEVGIKKLSQAMVSAKEGSKSSQAAFKALGISMEEVKNNSPSEVLDTVIKKLADMEDSAARNALGNELLGKSYSDMLPLLNAGSQGIEDLKNRADELGLVMSEEGIKANVAFGDTLADVKKSFGQVTKEITTKMLPVLMIFLNWVLDHMPEIQAIISAVFKVVQVVVSVTVDIITKHLIPIFSTLVDFVKEHFPDISKTVSEVFEAIKAFIEDFIAKTRPIWEGLWWFFGNVAETAWSSIKIIISGAIEIIKNIFKLFSAAMQGDWQGMWDAIKNIAQTLWGTVIELLGEFLSLMVETVLGISGKMLEAGAAIFNSLWDGIKSIWTGISNWVSDKINWLADKVMFWKDKKEEFKKEDFSGSYGDPNPDVKPRKPRPTNPTNSNGIISRMLRKRVSGSHEKGLPFVPYDGYIAELHKGERILTSEENKSLKASRTTNNYFNISKLVVREEADIKKVAKELYEMTKREKRWQGGVALDRI